MSKQIDEVELYILQHAEVNIPELIEEFKLSESTIRRYVDVLEEKGSIIKEYGRILAKPNDSLLGVQVRKNTAKEEKIAIAEIANDFIKDGDVIFIDSGTTHLPLINLLQQKEDVTVVTNNLTFATDALELDHPFQLLVVPGIINKNTYSLTGSSTLNFLNQFLFDHALFTCSGLSVQQGASNRTKPEGVVKQFVQSVSMNNMLLCDSSKFEQSFSYSFGAISDFDIIISEQEPPKKMEEIATSENNQWLWP